VRSMGAEPIVANGLEADAVRQAVARARPQVIVNQMTALSTDFNARKFDQIFSTTNRLRKLRAMTTCWQPPKPAAFAGLSPRAMRDGPTLASAGR
jgi:hypothetical protein